MNKMEVTKCSLCQRTIVSEFFQNKQCKHVYCRNCICHRHVPDVNKLKCFVNYCQNFINVDEMDEYFLIEQMKMIETEENGQPNNSKSQFNNNYNQKVYDNQYAYADNPNSAIVGKGEQYNDEQIQQLQKSNIYQKETNKFNNSEISQQSSKILYEMENPVYIKMNFEQRSKLNKEMQYDFKNSKEFCGRCLMVMGNTKIIPKQMACKNHCLCFSCGQIHQVAGYCDICDRRIV